MKSSGNRLVPWMGLQRRLSPGIRHAAEDPSVDRAYTQPAPRVDVATARRLVDDGRGWSPIQGASAYSRKSTAEFFLGLRSWPPVVRERSAVALGRHQDKADYVPRLLGMLASKDTNARLGACVALKALGPAAAGAVTPLRDTLTVDHLWLRIQAAEALAAIGPAARPAIPVLLRRLVTPRPRGPPRHDRALLEFRPLRPARRPAGRIG